MSYDKKTYQETENYLWECQAKLGHPYNTGWCDLHYEQEIERTKKKLAAWGKQLEIEFGSPG